MKILIGIREIANNIYEFAEALKEEHEVDTFAIKNRFYADNRYTHIISPPQWKNRYFRFLGFNLLLAYYFFRLFSKYDVFVYVWTTSFLPFKLDWFILRWLGKKVIVYNCGGDVRYRPIHYYIAVEKGGPFASPKNATYDNYVGETQGTRIFLASFFAQKMEELSGAAVVSARTQATFQGKDCFVPCHLIVRMMAGEKRAGDRPLILHAPSDPELKGTRYVLAAVERLQAEGYEITFECIQNKPNAYVRERLIDADIVIDQPGAWIGKFAAEALACGCVVFGGNCAKYAGFPDKSPVIQFSPDENLLYENLKRIITDKELRQKTMAASYAYWQENYSPESFRYYFRGLLDGTVPRIPPWPDQREMLLKYADSTFSRLIIKMFY
jgi:glycosyltransferase involved in cell wall biosynthesis